jgi:hypothetical protein
MGTSLPASITADTAVIKQLAEDLRTETSAETILERLDALFTALDVRESVGNRDIGVVFLRAGGLPTLIRLLKGTPTPHAATGENSMHADVSKKAALALSALLATNGAYGGIMFPGWVVPLLTDALRDAPDDFGRLVAAQALWALASTQLNARRIIADGGAMGLVLALLVDVGDLVWDKEHWGPAWDLADVLLCWEPAAVHDLQRAICGPSVDLAWMSLNVLRVRYQAPRLYLKESYISLL